MFIADTALSYQFLFCPLLVCFKITENINHSVTFYWYLLIFLQALGHIISVRLKLVLPQRQCQHVPEIMQSFSCLRAQRSQASNADLQPSA